MIRHTMIYYHANKKNIKNSVIYCLPWLRMCSPRVRVGLCLRVLDGESHCTHICKHAQHHTYDVSLHANGVCEWVWRSFFVIRDIWIETHLKCSKSRHVNLSRYFVSLFQPAAIHIRGPCWWTLSWYDAWGLEPHMSQSRVTMKTRNICDTIHQCMSNSQNRANGVGILWYIPRHESGALM